eukprot:4930971-Amphidinium_carterae.1
MRILTRPFQARAWIFTFKQLVFGRGGVIRSISAPEPFQSIVAKLIGKMTASNVNTGDRANAELCFIHTHTVEATKEWGSHSNTGLNQAYTPLMRLVLYLPASIMHAQQMTRGSSSLRCVQTRADTVLKLTRFLANEQYDITDPHDQLASTATELYHLFVEGACWKQGLTQHML